MRHAGSAQAALNHPNIAQIYGLEEQDGTPKGVPYAALVMELVEGEDLAVSAFYLPSSRRNRSYCDFTWPSAG